MQVTSPSFYVRDYLVQACLLIATRQRAACLIIQESTDIQIIYSWCNVLFTVTSVYGTSKLCRLWECIGSVTAPNQLSVSSKWFDTYEYRSLHSHRSLGSTGTFSDTWSSLLSDMRSDSWPWTKTGSEVKGEWPAFMLCLSSMCDFTKRFTTLVLFTHSRTHTHTHTHTLIQTTRQLVERRTQSHSNNIPSGVQYRK